MNKECLSYTTHAPNRLRIDVNATRDYRLLHLLVKLSKLNTSCDTCWFINLWKLSHTICSLGQEDDEDTPTSTLGCMSSTICLVFSSLDIPSWGHKLDLIAKVIASTLMCLVLLHSKDSRVTFTKSIHWTTSWSSCIIFSKFWACKDCDTTTSKPTCSKSLTLFLTSWMLLVVLYLDTRFESNYYLMQLFTSISALLNVPFRFPTIYSLCSNYLYKHCHDYFVKLGVQNGPWWATTPQEGCEEPCNTCCNLRQLLLPASPTSTALTPPCQQLKEWQALP